MTYCNSTRLAESNTGYDTNPVEQLLTLVFAITEARNESGPLANIIGSVGQLERISQLTSAEAVETVFLSTLIPRINLQHWDVSIRTPSQIL